VCGGSKPIRNTNRRVKDHDCRELSPPTYHAFPILMSSASCQSEGNMPRIPIEVIDEFLLYLNARDLRNCALVCKSWTPSCRRYLFRSVNFRDIPSLPLWCKSIPPAPNGPHYYARTLQIGDFHLMRESYPAGTPEERTPFLQQFMLFTNIQTLVIVITQDLVLDGTCVTDAFMHLSGTLRRLSIGITWSWLMPLAPFRDLERLALPLLLHKASESSPSPPGRRTFGGKFYFMDWYRTSEEFFSLLAEHDLQFSEMSVSGERWLRDTVWNRCLDKSAGNLEELELRWHWEDCERSPIHWVRFVC
jgi:hypothetical protein